jgi:hypothetical protein
LLRGWRAFKEWLFFGKGKVSYPSTTQVGESRELKSRKGGEGNCHRHFHYRRLAEAWQG